MKLIAIGGAFALLSSSLYSAAVIGTYTFTGGTGNVASFEYNGTAIDNVTVSNLTKIGVETFSSSGAFGARGWTTGAISGSNTFTGGINTDDYFEFTLSAVPGMNLVLTSLDFGVGRASTGPRQFEWRSSADDFASPLAEYAAIAANVTQSDGVMTLPDQSTGYLGNSIALTGGEFEGLSEVTFRLYAYNAEASTGVGSILPSLSFTVEAVPEPSTAFLSLLGSLGWFRRRRR